MDARDPVVRLAHPYDIFVVAGQSSELKGTSLSSTAELRQLRTQLPARAVLFPYDELLDRLELKIGHVVAVLFPSRLGDMGEIARTSESAFLNALVGAAGHLTPDSASDEEQLVEIALAAARMKISPEALAMRVAGGQMYCVKCRARRDDPMAVLVLLRNGRPAVKGRCPVCSTGMLKIGLG